MTAIEGLRVPVEPRAALAAAWTWAPTRPTTAAARYVPTVTGSVLFAPSL